MIGPRVSIRLSCVDCRYMQLRGQAVQVFCCIHPEIGDAKIGDTAATPKWCPEREDALGRAVLAALDQIVDIKMEAG